VKLINCTVYALLDSAQVLSFHMSPVTKRKKWDEEAMIRTATAV
jgi:hypothetical protein